MLQTATQINEVSVGYVVKGACLVLVLTLLGPSLADYAIRYAREQLEGISAVVRPPGPSS